MLFLLVDGATKVITIEPVTQTFVRLGYPARLAVVIGAIDLLCLALYVIPRTTVLGAVLLTGYLGGAVATHLRVGGGAFELLFPCLIGALLWAALLLRDHRLGALLPLRRQLT